MFEKVPLSPARKRWVRKRKKEEPREFKNTLNDVSESVAVSQIMPCLTEIFVRIEEEIVCRLSYGKPNTTDQRSFALVTNY